VPGFGVGFPDGFVVCLVGFVLEGDGSGIDLGPGEHRVIIAYSGSMVGKE